MSSAVSVIIPAYSSERWEDLVAAVTSASRQRREPEEIIVVIDNNLELFERVRAELPEVTALPNAQDPGANGSRNTATEVARGKILAFLDYDAVAEPGWLEAHLSSYSDDGVLGTGGTVIPAWRGGAPERLPPELWWMIGCTWTGTPTERARIRNTIGSNMTVRADVLARIGGFQNALGRLERGAKLSGTADETEFCIRAAAAHPGGYFLHCPDAVVWHAVPASRTTWSYILTRARLEGRAKGMLVDFVGTSSGLESERDYVRRILPRAFVRELRAGLTSGRHGFERAAALAVAVTGTAASYVRTRAAARTPLGSS